MFYVMSYQQLFYSPRLKVKTTFYSTSLTCGRLVSLEPLAASTTKNMKYTPVTTTTTTNSNNNNPNSSTTIKATARIRLSITTTTPRTRVTTTSKEQGTAIRVGTKRNTRRAIKIRAGIRIRGMNSRPHQCSKPPLLEGVRGAALEVPC